MIAGTDGSSVSGESESEQSAGSVFRVGERGDYRGLKAVEAAPLR